MFITLDPIFLRFLFSYLSKTYGLRSCYVLPLILGTNDKAVSKTRKICASYIPEGELRKKKTSGVKYTVIINYIQVVYTVLEMHILFLNIVNCPVRSVKRKDKADECVELGFSWWLEKVSLSEHFLCKDLGQ